MSMHSPANPEPEGAPRLRLMREQLDDLDALLDKMLQLPLPVVTPRETTGLRLAEAHEEGEDAGPETPPLLTFLPTPPPEETLAAELAAVEARLTPTAEVEAAPMPPPPLSRTMTFLEQPMRPAAPAPASCDDEENSRPGWLLTGLGWLGILLLLGAAALTLGRWLAHAG